MRYLHSSLAALTPVLFAVSASADVVVLNAVKDNAIYEDNVGNSNGSGDHMFSGQTAMGSTRRSLLAFDIASSIPSGSTINSVTLQMYMSMTIIGDQDVGLYVLTSDWGEGASNAPGQEGGGTGAAPGDATWVNTFFPGSNWTTAGGDFVAAPSAVATIGGLPDFDTWNSAGLASDVQSMLDTPASNFGWMIRHVDESGIVTAKRFDSRSNPVAARRPMLTIDFSPPGGCVSSNFCSSTANSTGSPAVIGFTGSCVVADNALTLMAAPVPNQPGIFFYSAAQANGGLGVPFGNGLRCVGGGAQIYRLSVTFAAGNQLTFTPDLTTPPSASGLITAGSTWNFQAWYRDPAGGGTGFDLSDGLELTFQ